MIRLTDNLWVGNSADGTNLEAISVGAVLNVAHDLLGEVGWPKVEYMQVGLVDGPGNPQSAYYSAVLALHSLLKRHRTLVCCHTGGRSVAVAIMYLELCESTRGWNGWLELLCERVCIEVPIPHPAHREAFDKMNWRSMSKLIGVAQ